MNEYEIKVVVKRMILPILCLWIIFLILALLIIDIYQCSPYDPADPIRTSKTQAGAARLYRNGGDRPLKFTQDKVHLLKESTKSIIVSLVQRVTQLLDENQITYWMCAGSWLATIRHQGIIPWDDDTDIHLLESELPRLKSLHQKFWDAGLKIYQRSDSHCLRICSRHQGQEFPCIDIALMREWTVANFLRVIHDSSVTFTEKALKRLNAFQDVSSIDPMTYRLLTTVPVDLDKKTSLFHYIQHFECSYEVVQPYDRIFPLIEKPFEHFTVWCGRDDTLLDQMYPGFRTEARVEYTGWKQLFFNHALYYRLPHRKGRLLKDINIDFINNKY